MKRGEEVTCAVDAGDENGVGPAVRYNETDVQAEGCTLKAVRVVRDYVRQMT